MDLNLIKDAAPYLIPFFGVLFLIVFVKRYLFQGMMSNETYREQMERERLVLLHYTNLTSQLDDVIKQLHFGNVTAETAAKRLETLATAIDESVVHQILRLSEEEREIIRQLRNRDPLEMMLKKREQAEKRPAE
jgi:hypothetical protein